jgi:hypothetical protein
MKKEFLTPSLEIDRFNLSDILTTSAVTPTKSAMEEVQETVSGNVVGIVNVSDIYFAK